MASSDVTLQSGLFPSVQLPPVPTSKGQGLTLLLLVVFVGVLLLLVVVLVVFVGVLLLVVVLVLVVFVVAVEAVVVAAVVVVVVARGLVGRHVFNAHGKAQPVLKLFKCHPKPDSGPSPESSLYLAS
eukprot:jgi/Botrbrau1/22709/Bobra.0132s0048.1